MNSNFKITFEKPCMQNWNAMPKMQNGLFCGQCHKVVKDFTTMSDEELIATLTRKHKEELCGVFSKAQLEKTYLLEPPPERNSHNGWKLLMAGLLAFELPMIAQLNSAKEKTSVTQNREKKTYPAQNRYLKGKVTNRQTKMPVKATITLYSSGMGNDSLLNTSTDSNGYYMIRLPEKKLDKFFRLVFSDSVFMERSIVVDRDKIPARLNITMVPIREVEIITNNLPEMVIVVPLSRSNDSYSQGGIIPGYITTQSSPWQKVRSFFWKVFHPVKAIRAKRNS